MPRKKTVEKAKADLAQGKRPSTAAGEFVREEVDHIREGKHGARSTRQAVAIGLSKARRAGVPLPPPPKGRTSERTRRSAKRDLEVGQGKRAARPASSRRKSASRGALKHEPKGTASSEALSKQSRSAAARRRSRKASSTRATPRKATAKRSTRSSGARGTKRRSPAAGKTARRKSPSRSKRSR